MLTTGHSFWDASQNGWCEIKHLAHCFPDLTTASGPRWADPENFPKPSPKSRCWRKLWLLLEGHNKEAPGWSVCLSVLRTEPVVWAEFCNRSPVYRTDECFHSPPRLRCETHPPCCPPYLKVNWHAKVLCVVGESNTKPTSSHATAKKETQGEGWEADRWETLICWSRTAATHQTASPCSLSPFLRVRPYLPMLMGGSCTHSFNKHLLSALLVFYCCPNKLCGFK